MTDKFIPSTQFIEKLPNICVDLELVSVYDMDCYSVPQLLYRLAQKINDTITNMEHNDSALKAQLDDLQVKLEYLLGEGLNVELQKIFEKMYADGTLQSLVEGAMVDINKRLDDIETNMLSNRVLFMPIAKTTSASGDCSLIITKTGKTIVIDTGASHSYSLIKESLIKNKVDKIDYMIISHYHSDHCQNIFSLKDDFNMSNTIYYLPKHTTKFRYEDDNILTAVGNNIKIYPNNQEVLTVEDIKITFFNCGIDDMTYYDNNTNNYNNYSMCCYVESDTTKILFTGDISEMAQARINEKGYLKKVDLLKVEHHAYDNLVNNDYVRIVNPTYAVVSMSQTQFKNPTPVNSQSLTLLNALGTDIACSGKELVEFRFNKFQKDFIHEYSISGLINNEYGYFFIYVDSTYDGVSDGTYHRPFSTIREAVAETNKFNGLNIEIKVKNSIYNGSEEQLRIVNSTNTIKLPTATLKALSIRNSNVVIDELTLVGEINRALNVESSILDFKKITVNGNVYNASFVYDGRGVAFYKSIINGETLEISNKGIALGLYNSTTAYIKNLAGVNNKYAVICVAGSSLTTNTASIKYIDKIKDFDITCDLKGAMDRTLDLKANNDLNDFRVAGSRYKSTSGATTITLLNRPEGIGYACLLEVEKLVEDGSIKQTITSRHFSAVNASSNKTGIWIRTYNPNDGWSNWFEMYLK